jgi:hypothetical protein
LLLLCFIFQIFVEQRVQNVMTLLRLSGWVHGILKRKSQHCWSITHYYKDEQPAILQGWLCRQPKFRFFDCQGLIFGSMFFLALKTTWINNLSWKRICSFSVIVSKEHNFIRCFPIVLAAFYLVSSNFSNFNNLLVKTLTRAKSLDLCELVVGRKYFKGIIGWSP